MNTRRDKNYLGSAFHFESADTNVYEEAEKKIAEDATCANETESNRRNDATRESTKFLVKYRDRLYDIYDFVDYHPGGKNTLMRFKDQILDGALAKYPHSESAYYLLEEFAVQRQERYNEYEVSNL